MSSICWFCHSVLYLYHHLLTQNLFQTFLSSAEHKCYFEESGKPNSCWSRVTSRVFYMLLSSGPATVWLPTFFKILNFVFSAIYHALWHCLNLTFGYSKCRWPLRSQDVQTNTSVTVNIGVVDFCCKCDLSINAENIDYSMTSHCVHLHLSNITKQLTFGGLNG